MPVSLANAAGYGAFALLLAEGTAYWVAKHAQVSKRRPELPGAGWFRVARKANIFVLAAGVRLHRDRGGHLAG